MCFSGDNGFRPWDEVLAEPLVSEPHRAATVSFSKLAELGTIDLTLKFSVAVQRQVSA